MPDEGVSHSVTPLWAAAVSGRLAVVKTLLRHGACVDAVSDSGSTPVRSACYIVRPGIGGSTNHLVKLARILRIFIDSFFEVNILFQTKLS